MEKITMVECSTCGELTENNGFTPICDDCEQVMIEAHSGN